MSHRLKLNAVHFANSLEDEKSLLDTSTEVLESKSASLSNALQDQADQIREPSRYTVVQEELIERLEQRKGHDLHDPRCRAAGHDHLRLDLHAHPLYLDET